MKLPDKVYNVLKWVFILAVPICSFIISLIMAINTGDTIAIITAIGTGIESLVGIVIKVSDGNYKKEIKAGDPNG